MIKCHYWIRATGFVHAGPGDPTIVQEFAIRVGITRDAPISEFPHVHEVGKFLADGIAKERGFPPGTFELQIDGWQRLEEGSAILLPSRAP